MRQNNSKRNNSPRTFYSFECVMTYKENLVSNQDIFLSMFIAMKNASTYNKSDTGDSTEEHIINKLYLRFIMWSSWLPRLM